MKYERIVHTSASIEAHHIIRNYPIENMTKQKQTTERKKNSRRFFTKRQKGRTNKRVKYKEWCLCANGVLMWKISIKRKSNKNQSIHLKRTHRSSSNSNSSIFLSLSFVRFRFFPFLCTFCICLSRSHCAFLYDDFCCFAFHVSGRTSVGIYMKMLSFYLLSTTTSLISPNRYSLFAKFLISRISSSFFLLKKYRHNFVIAHSHDYAFEGNSSKTKNEWGR